MSMQLTEAFRAPFQSHDNQHCPLVSD